MITSESKYATVKRLNLFCDGVILYNYLFAFKDHKNDNILMNYKLVYAFSNFSIND